MKNLLFAVLLVCLLTGCATAPKSEADVFEEVVQLTSDFRTVEDMAFTTDGKWVALEVRVSGEAGHQLFVARVLRKDERIIGLGPAVRTTPAGSHNTGPRFSRDGVSILFASTAQTNGLAATAETPARDTEAPVRATPRRDPALEIFRADGWQGAIAAVEPGRGVNLVRHPLTDNDVYDGAAFFAPDGKRIYFVSERGPESSRFFAMRPDGDAVTPLTDTAHVERPTFTPDGRSLLFDELTPGSRTSARTIADVTYDPAGTITGITKRRPSVTVNPKQADAWHPDGTHLYESARFDGTSTEDVHVVRADGSKRLRLTFHPGRDVNPVILRDGKYMAWISDRGAIKTPQLFIGKLKPLKAW